MKKKLKIEREFSNLSVPITDEEQEKLEMSLLKEGCLEPIIVWQGIIVDGHKRYKFCTFENIEYEVKEMDFATRDEAIIWICRLRIPETKKRSVIRRYLIGKWYKSEMNIYNEQNKGKKTDHKSWGPDNPRLEHISAVAYQLAKDVEEKPSTIGHMGTYALTLDSIAEKEPELFKAIIREEVKTSEKELRKMRMMDSEKLIRIRQKKMGITNENDDVRMRHKGKHNRDVKKESSKNEMPIVTGIKEMPVFDPDMELKGLSYTIPTWINVMAKTEKKMNVEIATDLAKENLRTNLILLQIQADSLLEALK